MQLRCNLIHDRVCTPNFCSQEPTHIRAKSVSIEIHMYYLLHYSRHQNSIIQYYKIENGEKSNSPRYLYGHERNIQKHYLQNAKLPMKVQQDRCPRILKTLVILILRWK